MNKHRQGVFTPISRDKKAQFLKDHENEDKSGLRRLTRGVDHAISGANTDLNKMLRGMAKRGPVYLGNSDSGTGIQVAPGKKGEQGENTTEE